MRIGEQFSSEQSVNKCLIKARVSVQRELNFDLN